MLLVQISAVHCGPQFREGPFQDAVKEINALSPDAIIVFFSGLRLILSLFLP